MSETWVINNSPSSPSSYIDLSINFVSNETNFYRIEITHDRPWGIAYSTQTTVVDAWNSIARQWSDQEYRTVTFDTEPTGELLTWLQANAVKQEPPQPETWLINENASLSSGQASGIDIDINYSVVIDNVLSTQTHFKFINWYHDVTHVTQFAIQGTNGKTVSGQNNVLCYGTGGPSTKIFFIEDRKIIFDTAPTGDLLTWLQSNAVKQQPEPTTTINLSTIITQTGKHLLMVKSKLPSYLDSQSEIIEYTKN